MLAFVGYIVQQIRTDPTFSLLHNLIHLIQGNSMTIFYYVTTALFGIVVWALRLEGRVNTGEQRFNDLKELINTKFDGVNEKFEAQSSRFDRIENAIISHSKSYRKE